MMVRACDSGGPERLENSRSRGLPTLLANTLEYLLIKGLEA
ncbi:MAG: hypothetical protein ACLPZM_09050 [Thermoplasmata archaeon]